MKGLKSKTFEHRLKLMSQEEQLLRNKLDSAETAISKKEQELLLAMQGQSGNTTDQQLDMIEFVETNEKYRLLQEKCNIALKELEDLQTAHSERERSFNYDMEQMTNKLKASENERLAKGRSLEQYESELLTLKSLLKDRDNSYKQAEVTISILQQVSLIIEIHSFRNLLNDFAY